MYEVVRRKFTAFKYPRGSPERNLLNKSSITSEYGRHNKYLVLEGSKPLLTFKTREDAEKFVADPNKEKYKPKNKIKKYTKTQFINSRNFFNAKKRFIKNSM